MTKCMTPPRPIRPRVEQHCPGADYWHSISPVLVCRRRQIPPIAVQRGFSFSTAAFRRILLLRSPQASVRGQRSSKALWHFVSRYAVKRRVLITANTAFLNITKCYVSVCRLCSRLAALQPFSSSCTLLKEWIKVRSLTLFAA